MAYIIGLLKPEEKEELERRGWEVERVPKGFDVPPSAKLHGLQYGMVYIDNNMLQIMSGNDWDKGPPKTVKTTIRDIQVTEREVEIPTHCPKCQTDLFDKEGNPLRVWEYSDQARRGHLQNDGDEDDEHESSEGINTAASDLDGGDGFISNVGIYCECGYALAEGKFEVTEYKGAQEFLVEVRSKGHPHAPWLHYSTFDTSEAAQSSMQDRIDTEIHAEVRMLVRSMLKGKIMTAVLHTWPVPPIMPPQPPSDTKKTNAKKRTR